MSACTIACAGLAAVLAARALVHARKTHTPQGLAVTGLAFGIAVFLLDLWSSRYDVDGFIHPVVGCDEFSVIAPQVKFFLISRCIGKMEQPSQSTPQPAAPAPKRTGLAIAALVLGGIAFTATFFPVAERLAIVPGLVAAVCGIVAMAKSPFAHARGMACTGTIAGGIAVMMFAATFTAYRFRAHVARLLSRRLGIRPCRRSRKQPDAREFQQNPNRHVARRGEGDSRHRRGLGMHLRRQVSLDVPRHVAPRRTRDDVQRGQRWQGRLESAKWF